MAGARGVSTGLHTHTLVCMLFHVSRGSPEPQPPPSQGGHHEQHHHRPRLDEPQRHDHLPQARPHVPDRDPRGHPQRPRDPHPPRPLAAPHPDRDQGPHRPLRHHRRQGHPPHLRDLPLPAVTPTRERPARAGRSRVILSARMAA
ncbi:hypothetical protein MICRO116_1020002 [Micrococcus sp. 116]|nr:hypothetical protein MICRO116_1020002 [Micrococcus sp. 116]